MNYSNFVTKSREWLEVYIKTNHLESVTIGISGGIDSTCSAAIASPVCEKLNIPLIGRSLPTNTNKNLENNIAIKVGTLFCSDFKLVSITDICDNIIHEIELSEGKLTNLQKGNIKARYRMMYLRNLASIHQGIVLDNDNFTEWNLGFWTVGGDSPADVNLGLHYLWKTEIYELAKYLAEQESDSSRGETIKASIELTPTDGNGVSNSDCEQFGLDNYEQVDDVLKTMYYSKFIPTTEFKDKIEQYKKQGIALVDSERAHHFEEYIRLIDSYNEQGVDKVMLLHQNTKYKRKELPIKPTKEELGL